MPIDRTTDETIPDQTHAWIDEFRVTGLMSGALEIHIQYNSCWKDGSGNPMPVENRAHVLTGQAALDFVTANAQLYADMKTALYQKLIDDGVEAGTIE